MPVAQAIAARAHGEVHSIFVRMSRPSRSDARVARPDDAHEAALATRLIAGDPAAAERAFHHFAPLVHGALARALGPGDDVRDLTQEVFLRLFRKVRGLQDPQALRSFVYSIAMRVARAELRRRFIRRIMRLSDTGVLPEPAAPSAQDPDARQALVRLYQLLDRLTPRDRLAYVLRYLEDLPVDEVASALDVSRATAKRRLAHASQRMTGWIARDPVLRLYQVEGGRDEGQG